MSNAHTDAEEWNDGNGISVMHRRLVYHFQELKNGYVHLNVVDELDGEESYRGEQIPAIPKDVHRRLSAEGYTVIA